MVGLWLICLSAGSYIPVLGALLMTGLIIKVSGVALLEKTLVAQKLNIKSTLKKLVLSFRGFQKSNPHRISLMNIFARKWVLPLITL